jgi:hypothetical protein
MSKHHINTPDPAEGVSHTFTPEQAEAKGLTAEEAAAWNSMVEQGTAKPDPREQMFQEQFGKYLNPEQQTEEQPTQEEPSLLAGKYKTQEDLEKAYLELQSKLGQQTSPEEAKEADVAQNEETSEAPEWMSQDFEEGTPGYAIQRANKDFLENGQISDETFAALEQAGIPREVAETYAQNAQAELDKAYAQTAQEDAGEAQELQTIVDELGGQEALRSIQEWAGKNLTKEEQDYVDQVAENGSVQDIGFLYKQLQARQQATANIPSKESQLVKGQGVVQNAADVYRSREEMLRDQKDPRYKTDPAFRSRVYDKLSRSRI